MSKNKNVSKNIRNGTLVTFKDSYLEKGRNTKSKGKDIRVGAVIDSNRFDEIAVLKQQHSLNAIVSGKRTFNPNIKTKKYKGQPLKVDGKNIRIKTDARISSKTANELKRKSLKEFPKNIRKPNKRRLKELKGRK